MTPYKWDWDKLDKELVKLYSVNKKAVSIFSDKYGISRGAIYYKNTQ